MAMPNFEAFITKASTLVVQIITQTSVYIHINFDATVNANNNSSMNVGNCTPHLRTFTIKYFRNLESQVSQLVSKFGFCIDRKKNKGNPLSMEIHNTLLTGMDKDPKFENFNNDIDPITHIQGFEYIMESKYGVNDHLKVKYFPMSLTGEAQKWFHSLEPGERR